MAKKRVDENGEVFLDQDAANYNTTQNYNPVFWKTPFNHDTNAESDRCGSTNYEPTKTQQHLAADQDINNILAKFTQGGQVMGTDKPLAYGDFSEEFDLQSKIVTAWEVEQAWQSLTPEIRNTLRNPKMFVSYIDHCLERGDLEPLRALGLAKALETAVHAPRDPTPPTPPGGEPPAPSAAKEAPSASKT